MSYEDDLLSRNQIWCVKIIQNKFLIERRATTLFLCQNGLKFLQNDIYPENEEI